MSNPLEKKLIAFKNTVQRAGGPICKMCGSRQKLGSGPETIYLACLRCGLILCAKCAVFKHSGNIGVKNCPNCGAPKDVYIDFTNDNYQMVLKKYK